MMLKSSPWRVTLVATSATLMTAVPLMNSGLAYASTPAILQQPYPPTLSTATVPAGEELGFAAKGFNRYEEVTASLVRQPASAAGPGPAGREGDENGSTYTADKKGRVYGCLTIRKGTRPGTYLFTLTGERSGSVSTQITVERAGNRDYDHGHNNGHDAGSAQPKQNALNLDENGLTYTQNGLSLSLTDQLSMSENGSSLSGGRDSGIPTRPVKQDQQGPGIPDNGPFTAATGHRTGVKTDGQYFSPVGYTDSGHGQNGSSGSAGFGSATDWALIGLAAGLTAAGARTVTVVRRRRTLSN